MNAKSLRIQKIIKNNPEMTDSQIAKKIGMDNEAGRERVKKERSKGVKMKILEAVENESAWSAADRAADAVRVGDTYSPERYQKIATADRSVWAKISKEQYWETIEMMPPMFCKQGFQVTEAMCSAAEGELFLTIIGPPSAAMASYQTKKAAQKGFSY